MLPGMVRQVVVWWTFGILTSLLAGARVAKILDKRAGWFPTTKVEVCGFLADQGRARANRRRAAMQKEGQA
jgi:hypothetical protein